MGFAFRLAEILLRGAIASYFLLYALDFQKSPNEWTEEIGVNIYRYDEILGTRMEGIREWV